MELKKNKLYPMTFKPLAEKAEWGGSIFIGKMGKSYTEKVEADDAEGKGGKKKYVEKALTMSDKLGESWELADMGFRDSEVAAGWLAGSTISEILETYLEDLVGETAYSYFGRQFPLMVKMLDVHGRTPLMVCPDDEVAGQRYDTLGKLKLWYVMDAEPGAKLYMGFKNDISATELYNRCHDGSLEEVLNVIVPHKGDAFLMTPGLVHAASGGLVLAEIAESSDLDFKIYNWGDSVNAESASFTADESGVGRNSGKTSRRSLMSDSSINGVEELSLEAAFDFLNMSKYDNSLTISASGDSKAGPAHDPSVKSIAAEDANAGKVTDKIVERREFSVTKIDLKDAIHINTGTTDAFVVYVCVSGSASLQIQKEDAGIERYEVNEGGLILVPAEVTDFFLVPQDRYTVLLEATIEPHEDVDQYIDPDVEATLPSEEEPGKLSVEEFLRRSPGRMN